MNYAFAVLIAIVVLSVIGISIYAGIKAVTGKHIDATGAAINVADEDKKRRRNALIERVWRKRARRLGISVEEAKAKFDEDIIKSRMEQFGLTREEVIAEGLHLKPAYLVAAERRGKNCGMLAEQILREDLERVDDSTKPS